MNGSASILGMRSFFLTTFEIFICRQTCLPRAYGTIMEMNMIKYSIIVGIFEGSVSTTRWKYN